MRCGARCRCSAASSCASSMPTPRPSPSTSSRACSGRSRVSPACRLSRRFYRRPLRHGELSVPEGGGRVNHLAARPALALFYPQLTHINQPLAGEIAARRDLLWRLPFATGYGVEIAMLIDALHELGIDGIAQVDLDEHRNETSRCPRSRRWRSRCSRRSSPACRPKGVSRPRPGGAAGVARRASGSSASIRWPRRPTARRPPAPRRRGQA